MALLNFLKILDCLADHRVDFILIGDVSAALNGAPLDTLDVDVVHSRTPENVRNVLVALEQLDAVYRFQPERKLRPNESHISSPGHQLLTTTFGNLDLLDSVTKQRTYEDLLPHSAIVAVSPTLSVRVLNLEML